MKDPKVVPTARNTPTPALPRGWSARVIRRQAAAGETSNRVLHAATMPMTSSRSDFGSDIAERLGVDDALVVLMEYGPESAGTALFAAEGLPRPDASRFDPNMLQRTLAGQSGYQRFFSVDGRPLCLYVVLGSHARRARTVPRVHALLDAVDPRQGRLTLTGGAS